MNAADYYGLDELKKACSGFIQCCVNVDTVCALLATAERYIQYKCTKTLVQKVRKKMQSVYESPCGKNIVLVVGKIRKPTLYWKHRRVLCERSLVRENDSTITDRSPSKTAFDFP